MVSATHHLARLWQISSTDGKPAPSRQELHPAAPTSGHGSQPTAYEPSPTTNAPANNRRLCPADGSDTTAPRPRCLRSAPELTAASGGRRAHRGAGACRKGLLQRGQRTKEGKGRATARPRPVTCAAPAGGAGNVPAPETDAVRDAGGGRSHDERSPAPPPPPASSRRRRRAAPPSASRRGGGRADCDVLAAGAAGPRGWHGGAARVSPGGEAAAPRGRREAHPLLRCPSALPQVCALMVSSGGGRSPVLELRVWVAALRHSAALSRHLFEVQHADGKPWRSLSLSYKAAKSSHLTV